MGALGQFEQTARWIECEGGSRAERVRKWNAETGRSGATFWRVLKRHGS